MDNSLNNPKVIARFWNHINIKNENDCWEWKDCKSKSGYGSFRANNRSNHAHRIAYILTFGEISSESLFVCHKCDNPPCCNPKHLFLGTQTHNMRDAIRKKRFMVKVSLSDAYQMRLLYKTRNYTQKELAEKFNCDQTNVSLIVRDKARKWYPAQEQIAAVELADKIRDLKSLEA